MFHNIHVHSTYSVKDALPEPYDIAKKSKEQGKDAFFITDHGSLGSFIQAYKAQDEVGIQFVPGCEFYIIPDDEFWAFNKNNSDIEVSKIACKYFHLIAIAKNQDGLKSLFKIFNEAEYHWGKPCIKKSTLFANTEGLIISTACVMGESLYFLRHGEKTLAYNALKTLQNYFHDDLYVELQYHGLESLREPYLYSELIKMAKELKIAMIATTDAHYINKEDAEAHDIYKNIYRNTDYNYQTQSFPKAFEGSGYYLKTGQEIREDLAHYKDLTPKDIDTIIENTQKLRDKCKPTYFYKGEPLKDKTKELKELLNKGFIEKRKGTEYQAESLKRVRFEMEVIEKMNFAEYFMNVYAIVKRANDLGLMVGMGRGSAAGSEVCYLLGITKIDPIKNNLIFERFLNPERVNYPDIDLDIQTFSDDEKVGGKDKLIASLESDLFPFTGHITTERRATTLDLFKKLGKSLGIPFTLTNKITTDDKVKNTHLQEEHYTGWLLTTLEKLNIVSNEKWQKLEHYMDFCYRFGGCQHGDKATGLLWNKSIHASGVILYPSNDTSVLPKDEQGIPYKGHDLEELGYIKYDILGLDALNPISHFQDILKQEIEDFNWEKTDDLATWETFQKADTDFVFQFSSFGMKRVLKTVKPKNIAQLAELNALYRPGCIQSGILDRYLTNNFTDEDKILGNFLKEEFGESHAPVLIFQEDIMKVVQKMAGFTLTEADWIRRAMGRKDHDVMERYKAQFIKNFNREKYGDIADTVWNTINEFASYGFNKSHSVAYGTIAYWQAYLFTHHKNEYLEYLLQNNIDKHEVIQYLSKDHTIVFPSLSTTNDVYRVTDTKLYLPSILQENVSEAEYVLGINADRSKMIVRFGILDSYCIDRVGLREFAKSLNLKPLMQYELEELKQSKTLDELLVKLQALDLIEYEATPTEYKIKVQKPRSVFETSIKRTITPEIMQHNAQADIRAYGIVRDFYADAFPELPTAEIEEQCAAFKQKTTQEMRYVIKKIVSQNKAVANINRADKWYRCVLKEAKLTGYAQATLVFSNGQEGITIPKAHISEFRKLDKNTPIEVRFNLSYWHKESDIRPVLKIEEIRLYERV